MCLLNTPFNITGVICNYLSSRSILVNSGRRLPSQTTERMHTRYFSCTSHLVHLSKPLILKEIDLLVFLLYAFVDDLCLLFSGRRLLDFELYAASVLHIFYHLLLSLDLQLIAAKSQNRRLGKPRKLKRKPRIRIMAFRMAIKQCTPRPLLKTSMLNLRTTAKLVCTNQLSKP